MKPNGGRRPIRETVPSGAEQPAKARAVQADVDLADLSF